MTPDVKQVVLPGQNWRENDSFVWCVVTSVSTDGIVRLSGPGPCKAVFSIRISELLKDWKQVV